MENLKLLPLNKTELVSINGGSKLSEDLFYAAGYIWQSIKNLGSAFVDKQVAIAQEGTHPAYSHNGGLK